MPGISLGRGVAVVSMALPAISATLKALAKDNWYAVALLLALPKDSVIMAVLPLNEIDGTKPEPCKLPLVFVN